MPEGHKTHFIARQHRDLLAGQRLRVTSPQGRFSSDAAKVCGKTLTDVTAAGKHLFYHFGKDLIVHIHLGRYGSFREQLGEPEPRGLVRMRMVGKGITVDLNGPTQCRLIDDATRAAIVDALGPDPLADGRWQDAWEQCKLRSQPIGALLLDQSIFAGVGNIFRAELLFQLRMDPNRSGSSLTVAEFRKLWNALAKMMKVSLEHGSIITVPIGRRGDALRKLPAKERTRIYGQTICPECGGEIVKLKMAGRTLYACPHCQGF